MAQINLLPWREERRKRLKKDFFVSVALPLRGGATSVAVLPRLRSRMGAVRSQITTPTGYRPSCGKVTSRPPRQTESHTSTTHRQSEFSALTLADPRVSPVRVRLLRVTGRGGTSSITPPPAPLCHGKEPRVVALSARPTQ